MKNTGYFQLPKLYPETCNQNIKRIFQANNKKISNPFWTKDLDRYFSKKDKTNDQ